MTEYIQFYEGKKMGVQDETGAVVIPPAYDFVSTASEGVFQIELGGKLGYVDVANRPLFPFTDQVEYFGPFSEGLAAFYRGNKYGFIDKSGREVIAPQFYYAGEFRCGLAVVRNETQLHGAIDTAGRLVVDYKFEHLIVWPERRLFIFSEKVDGKQGLLDFKGNEVMPPIYEYFTERDGKVFLCVTLDNGDLREGEVDLETKAITWNNNKDKHNEMRRQRVEMESAFQNVVDEYFKTACPCRFPRFRYLAELNTERVRCIDGELLFSLAARRYTPLDGPDESPLHFECRHCGAKFSQQWIEIHAYFSVLAVKMTLPPEKPDVGAAVKEPVPLCFGFQHLEVDPPPKGAYTYQDVPTVARYLTERAP